MSGRKSFRRGASLISFSFLLLFFSLAVGQLDSSIQEETRSLFKSFLLALSHELRTAQVPEGVPFPPGPRKRRGRPPRKGQVVATTSMLGSGLLLSCSAT